MHSAFYTTSNSGYNLHIEPRDTNYVADDTMDGSGEQTNVQNLTYGFIIKLHSPNTNKTSYCPLVSTYNTIVITSIAIVKPVNQDALRYRHLDNLHTYLVTVPNGASSYKLAWIKKIKTS